ncbi:MAG TPA: tetratricopeptide repeat protein [Opitutaceae bacterium]|nr:tetratricopeptide repeat protein [Opitutaceae bacterium]
MSLSTFVIFSTAFALLYAVAFTQQLRAYQPIRMAEDFSPGIKEASWSGLRPGGAFEPDEHRPDVPVRQLAFEYRSPGSLMVERLRRAALAGDPRAQFNLGLCYENGRDVEKDLTEAIRWFRAAAEQGYDEAQYALGCCYNGEEGFPRDAAEAIKWWTRAAEQGFADAQYCLGLSYYMGQGVAKDVAEATRWWRHAAEQDHPNAEYFLGLCYFTGLGVEKEPKLALYWLRRASALGNENARLALKKIGDSGEATQARN